MELVRLFVYKLPGVIGLALIIWGLLVKNRKQRDRLYIWGGLFLLYYSLLIEDYIFAVLQVLFILATVYDRTHLEFRKQHQKTE